MSAIKKNSGKEKIKIISALWNCFRKYQFFFKGVATNKQKRIYLNSLINLTSNSYI